MVPGLSAMVWGGLNLLIVGAILFYAGLVTVIYLTKGFRYGPPFNWRDPVRAAEDLLIWTGVKFISVIVRTSRPLYEMFSETSAELGEWLLGQRSAKVEAAVWSHLRH